MSDHAPPPPHGSASARQSPPPHPRQPACQAQPASPPQPASQAQPSYHLQRTRQAGNGYASAPAVAVPARAAHRALRLAAITAVGIGVLVLAAAAFLISYPGVHAIARHAGVAASLARVYPVIFDAVLVIAFAAVLSLRGAGLASRCWAWLCLLALLAAAAAAGAVHSAGVTLPHRPAAATAAVLPWALVLVGFTLLLAMLRHARLHRAASAAAAATTPPPPGPALVSPPRASEPVLAEPESAELASAELASAEPVPAERVMVTQRAGAGARKDAPPAVFHRLWSSPVPPEEDEDYDGGR